MFRFHHKENRGRGVLLGTLRSPTNDEEEGIDTNAGQVHQQEPDAPTTTRSSIVPSWIRLSSSRRHHRRHRRYNRVKDNEKLLRQNQNDITMHHQEHQMLLQEIQTMKDKNKKQTIQLEMEFEKLLNLEEKVVHALEEGGGCHHQGQSFSDENENEEKTRKVQSPTFHSLSCIFRLLFASLYYATANVYDTEMTRLLCPSCLLLSIIFSGLQGFQNRATIGVSATIGLVGWFINLLGAIIFVVTTFPMVHDFIIYEEKPQKNSIDPLTQLAFGFLALGHTVELLCTFLQVSRQCKRIMIILLGLAAYILSVIEYKISPIVLIIHALLQYASLFCHNNQTPDKNKRQSRSEPEPLPNDMLDAFTLMMASNDLKTWNFGFLVFFMQSGLSIMILMEQALLNKNHVPLGVSVIPSFFFSFSQFWALLLAIFWQTDILTSIRMVSMFWYEPNGHWPYEKIYAKDGKFLTWFDKVLLPSLFRFLGGLLVLTTSFVIIVKSNDALNLFKDFTALILISDIDNIIFRLSNEGYFGKRLKSETEKIKEIRVVDDSNNKVFWIPVRLFMLLVVFGAMLGGWSYFVLGQHSRTFFLMQYPKCNVTFSSPYNIGNGYCEVNYNTEECDFDGGDCIQFNEDFPNCNTDMVQPEKIGDGVCDGGEYNREECGYDGGDCIVEEYPDCHIDFNGVSPNRIGDGRCDSGNYNTEECGYDGGDCVQFNAYHPKCKIAHPSQVGDGRCDGGEYDTEECGFDGGDCTQFNKDYPDCPVDHPYLIGNSICDSGNYNTAECGYDGGDCEQFNIKYPNCRVDYPQLIGDRTCQGGDYNTEECGYDGGDCLL